MFAAPQTPDGWITTVKAGDDGRFHVDVVFPYDAELAVEAGGRESDLVFAARSRLARLGINVMPASPLVVDGATIGMRAVIHATVPAYGVEPFLAEVLQPGLRVGRLVFCPEERRLTSAEIDELTLKNQLQLPRSYSIDDDGRFRIRPQGCVYDLRPALTVDALRTILSREGGKEVLNRIQVRRDVPRIALEPGDGVITSCSMFLHRHYVVLESMATPLGQHLEAVVLDPITTRGMDVFLEFVNRSEQRIVNPTVAAAVYRAMPSAQPLRSWRGASFEGGAAVVPAEAKNGRADYASLAALFDRLEAPAEEARYSHRTVAVVDSMEAALAGGPPARIWCKPGKAPTPEHGADDSARLDPLEDLAPRTKEFGTSLLADLPEGAQTTVLLGYFPNLVEHTQICAAALRGKIQRLVFRRASYEHGLFFSARDHGRLADYEGLGIDVFWCQDDRQQVAQHVFRGLRGYFMEAEHVERFRSALIFACYGSSRLLPAKQVTRIEQLLSNLRDFFGEDIAVMTGGGPGAMQQATDVAHNLGMLVGASYIETEDQGTNRVAEFYQTFQSRSRHSRQRWFEIASFHLFFMGGVGTLEEVGLTLTDMKLGVIDRSPCVFFGRYQGKRYWRSLERQFKTMVSAGRAPEWLRSHLLTTDDPDSVIQFYKTRLQLG